jgi:predicted nuclease of predicted toxin-antitoxin system
MKTIQLRFLADESCDFAVVRALRANGYDVFAVSEVMNRSDDQELIEQAYRERRILLTEDKDFGRLVFASHMNSPGVILIRFPGNARSALPQHAIRLVQEHKEMLLGSFVVIQPGHTRIHRKVDDSSSELS